MPKGVGYGNSKKKDTPTSELPRAVKAMKEENEKMAKKAGRKAIKSSSKKKPPEGPVKDLDELRERAKNFKGR